MDFSSIGILKMKIEKWTSGTLQQPFSGLPESASSELPESVLLRTFRSGNK